MKQLILSITLLSFSSINPGCCASKPKIAPAHDDEDQKELARVVQQHNNQVRRRAMTVPVARQVQHLRRERAKTYRGDIVQEPGFADMARKLKRQMKEEEKAAVSVDIKPTGLRLSVSLD